MGNKSEFTVAFSKVGRTLIYEDSQGVLTFTFDVGPVNNSTKDKWNLHLDRRPLAAEIKILVAITAAHARRIDMALQRTADYVQSCGYIVAVTE